MKSSIVINTVVSILNIIIRHLWLLQKTLFSRRFMVVMALFFILPVHFNWAQIYVDACAEGPGNGSQANPYNTLESAVDAASPDDIIYVKGGFYPETLTITQARTITAYDGSAYVGTRGDGVIRRDVTIDLGEGITTNARVYYPSCGQGQQFPAVVYAHGLRNPNQTNLCRWCDDALRTDNTKDYLQADGLLNRLASSGIIAISFNWHGLTGFSPDQDIAEYIIKAIIYLSGEFGAGVDLDNVGLIGHSTGGAGVIMAANKIRDDRTPAQITGVGLIAPSWPKVTNFQRPLNLSGPVLVIHGTREHPCQVGLQPLEIYCESAPPKHLVYVTGANHFGYTDGICLDPDQERINECGNFDPYNLDPKDYLPYNPNHGWDNASWVGGKRGHEAQALQQRAASNYLQAFFSHYLQGDEYALGYLVQKDEGEQCGHSGEPEECMNDILFDPPSNCEPKRYFDDLQSLNVEVSVCSCTE